MPLLSLRNDTSRESEEVHDLGFGILFADLALTFVFTNQGTF